MASQEGSASEAAAVKTTPRDVLVMTSILKEMGVNEYEPRVVNQMVEFAYRYITDIVEDARMYCQHANRKTLSIDDVKLAVAQKLDHSFTSPPPREFLLEIARTKNSLPLPLISDRSGLRLPPERYCLTGNNYKVKAPPKKGQQQSRKQSSGKASKTSVAQSTTTALTTTATPKQMQPQSTTTTQCSSLPATSASASSQSQQNKTANTLPLLSSSHLKRKHEDDDYDA